jgi:predicted TIM-barrel fold metal-dependent hydrolase
MEIIDCHANIGADINNIRKKLFPPGQSAEQLLVKMTEHRISKAIVVPFPIPGGKFYPTQFWYEIENQQLMQVTRNKPLTVFPAVNPADPKSVENIRKFAIAYGIKGVKFSHQIPMGFSIEELIGHRLMDIVQAHNLVMMIHIGTGKEKGADTIHVTLDYAVKVAKRYPKIRFIFCHLGRLHDSMIDALQLENVYMDTAAFSMHERWEQFLAKDALPVFRKSSPKKIIEMLVNLGYEDKILFGSDEPYESYITEILLIKQAHISPEAKEKIFAGNVKKVVGL